MAAATAPRFQYLISKYIPPNPTKKKTRQSPLTGQRARGRTLDPVFAVFIGVSAACVRIHREEKAAGRAEGGVLQIVDTGLR
jgi:Non-classical export protein 1